ncbi:MAG TPA: DUF2169 domain-containing protein [Cellvibrionaceae bacterium]|nr:DUF2169 domain-containing protein [Cellvibrionaceae bacterium]HMW47521.1 DUF2169 domain-containing protein [Cellvibrionaceae bacterium]HMW70379.1 DUF2169 domain-containing protein [Cellvibrionaceae bacterium]HMY38481.1 DUF2169 domain-containing protein [Marinagarivorans sp.]HNG58370.1 DUF2169 domain-containing protein [Cellvibrionaceae bacterium]
MLQLLNHTPFAAQIGLFPNEEGVDTLYVVAKAHFNMANPLSLCDEQTPPRMEDVYYGEPGLSSLKYPSDFHPGKAATDVFMLGHACSPDKQPVYYLDTSLSLGNLHKTIRVWGARTWQGGALSQPQPFTHLPIIYENAYGGQQVQDGQVVGGEERNPIGKGFLGRQERSTFDGTAAPQLDDPFNPLRQLGDTPEPASYGPRAPGWLPRRAFAGTYDEAWQQNRAPFLPEDYSPRFMNSAHPDLIADGFLSGGEAVKILGMHPLGELQFQIPRLSLHTEITMGAQTHSPNFVLESILLEPNQLRFSLTYKARLICDKQALTIRQVALHLQR